MLKRGAIMTPMRRYVTKRSMYAAKVGYYSTIALHVTGNLSGKELNAVRLQDSAYVDRNITDEMVKTFASLTGDTNAIHLDDVTAAKTRFGKRIVHGLLVSSAIPALFSHCFPGAIYRSQQLQFVSPVFINDKVRTSITVTKLQYLKVGTIVTCDTICQTKIEDTWNCSIKGVAEVLLLNQTSR